MVVSLVFMICQSQEAKKRLKLSPITNRGITMNSATNQVNPGFGLQDVPIKCVECGSEFIYTIAWQETHIKKGWAPPKRCVSCRNEKNNKISMEQFKKPLSKDMPLEEMTDRQLLICLCKGLDELQGRIAYEIGRVYKLLDSTYLPESEED
jgi:hypothetical protein